MPKPVRPGAIGSYSAIVKKQETDVWAEDEFGKTIAQGEAGVDDAAVIQQALNAAGALGVIKVIGRFTLKSTVQLTNRYVVFDARGAEIAVDAGIVGIEVIDADWSEILISRIKGVTKSGNTGLKITEGDAVKVDVRVCENLDKGIHIYGERGANSLDNDIMFGQIGNCNYGIYIDGYDIQGLRVFGNFINNCSEAGVYINSTGFWWNYFDITAIDVNGGNYNFYATGSGYGNRCRISGFLGGASIYDIYEDMGRWWFEVPETWSWRYSIHDRSIIEQKTPYGIKEIDGWLHYKNAFLTPLKLINVNNLSLLTPSGCTITDNGDGTFRLSSSVADWHIRFNAGLPGSVVRYVIFKYRTVSGGLTADSIYYSTPSHGFSASYRRSLHPYIADGRWHVQVHDMWNLTSGGDDWKNSTINAMRIDFTANDDTVLDIAFIGLFGEAPLLSKNSGVATFSGDGSTTRFTIAHGLFTTPSKVLVTPMSADAAGDFYVTVDATNIYVNYKTAPPSGTDNVVLSWYAEV